MITVFAALAPVFALIVLGHVLSRRDFPAPGFWPMAERLTYYVLFPALLVDRLSRLDAPGGELWRMTLALVLAVLAVFALLLAVRRRAAPDGAAFTSVVQGAIRPNTYVGLSAAAALLGPSGLSLSAVALMTLIPLVNVLCVGALGRWGQNNSGSAKISLLRELAKNPPILSCVAGFALSQSGLTLPQVAAETLRVLGNASLPLGLLAVGAGLAPHSVTKILRPTTVSLTMKLLVLPLITAFLCSLFGVEREAMVVAVIFTAVPASVSSFILARQMGGDHVLMAGIITSQTAAAAVTMPLVLVFLGAAFLP